MNSNVQYVIDGVDKLSRKLLGIDKNVKRTDSAMRGLGASITGMLGIGTALMLVGKGFQMFTKYEAQMSTVKALTGATGDEFEALSAQAKHLGETTAFTAKQAGQGMQMLSMAGFNVNQIMSAMPAILSLAAAGTIDLGKAADIASNIISGMGMSARDTQRVVDVMAKTANRSNTDILEMGEAFKQVAPTLNALKVPLEDGASLIAILGNNGIKGTDATTSLNTSLGRLAKPTRQMQTYMAKLGFSVWDNNGEFIGFEQTIRKFNEATKDYTPEARLAATAAIFGAHANKQWTAVFNNQIEVMKDGKKVVLQGADAFKYYQETLADSAGFADKIAKEKLNNIQGSFTILMSAVEGKVISFMSGSGGLIKNIIDFATEFIQGMSPIIDVVRGIADQVQVLFVGLSSLGDFFKPVLERMGIFSRETSAAGKLVEFLTFTLNMGTWGFRTLLKIVTSFYDKAAPVLQVIRDIADMFIDLGMSIISIFEPFYNLFKLFGSGGNIMGKFAEIVGGVLKFITIPLRITIKAFTWFYQLVAAVVNKTIENIKNLFGFLAKIAKKLGFDETADKLNGMFDALDRMGNKRPELANTLSDFSDKVNVTGALGNTFAKSLTDNLPDDLLLSPKNLNINTDDKTGGAGGGTGGGKGAGTGTAINGVTAAAPKTFVINIDKLVEHFTVSATTVKEGANNIKEQITKVMLEALNDVSIQADAL